MKTLFKQQWSTTKPCSIFLDDLKLFQGLSPYTHTHTYTPQKMINKKTKKKTNNNNNKKNHTHAQRALSDNVIFTPDQPNWNIFFNLCAIMSLNAGVCTRCEWMYLTLNNYLIL